MLDRHRPLPGLVLAFCLSLYGSALPAVQDPQPAPPVSTEVPPAPPADPAQQPPAEPPLPQPGSDTSGSLPGTTGEPAVPPAAAAPAAPAIPGAGENRISFQLKFPPDKDGKGGGSAAGSAGSLEYRRDDYAVLSGGVKIRYQDVNIEADEAEIALDTKLVTATGHVIVDQGPRRMSGETMEYDLDTKTGKLTNATAQVTPDYYFSGKEVAKVGEDLYTVNDGVFTSCSQKVPDWSFKLDQARIEQEGYAHVRGASMRAKGIPVFYTPYILWPTKSERSSGFLVPNIGYSDVRGAYLGLAYFQTLGRSYDTTFHFDTYTQGYFGLGNEFRYRPSEGTKGDLLAYLIRDPETTLDDLRWKVEWSHETTDLPRGMRGGIQFQEYSDFDFFRDFERDFDRNTLRFIDSRAFVSGNWGPHLLNLQLNSRETFIEEDATIDQRKLPELEYRLRSTRIGKSPFYAQFQGSTSYLDISRPNGYGGKYGRIDAFPQLSLPIRSFPWLSLSLTGGERMTFYTDSLDPAGQAFTGEALTRALPFGSAQIIGPSFSRIIQKAIGDYGKFKHVIEPRWTYTYLGGFDEVIEVPLFDEVDRPFSTNSGRLALVNRVLAKPKDEKGSAREIFNLEFARAFSFDDDQPLEVSAIDPLLRSNDGPIEALLRWNPSDKITLRAQTDYSLLFSGISSTQLSGNYGFGRGNFVGATWFTRFRPELGDTLFNQLRFNGGLDILKRKLRLEGQVNYDIELRLLQQQRYILSYTSQCYGLRLEMRDFRAGEGPRLRDKDFRFSLSLKNVGTFLDLTSRSSSQAP